MLKPLEGKQIDESDILDVLEDVLPKDQQVNNEAAKALVTIVPEIKEAALTNTKLDAKWLEESLDTNLKDQGGTMAALAPRVRELIQLDEADMALAIERLKADWPRITQSVIASDYGEVSDIKQHAKGSKGDINQNISASGHGKVSRVDQGYEQGG